MDTLCDKIVSLNLNNQINVWNVTTGSKIVEGDADHFKNRICFSPKREILAGNYGGITVIRQDDIHKNIDCKNKKLLLDDSDLITSICFSHDDADFMDLIPTVIKPMLDTRLRN